MPLDPFADVSAGKEDVQQQGGFLDPFNDPSKRTAADIAARSLFAGRSWEELQGELTANGYAKPDEKLGQRYNLQLRRRKLDEEGIGTLQAYKQFYQPFGSLVSLPVGGRSVGNREYQLATQRFNDGKATDDDLDAIATYDALQSAKKNLEDSGLFGKTVAVAGTLGQLVPETLAGGAIIGRGVKGYQALRGAKSVAEPVFVAAGKTAPLLSPAAITAGTKWFGQQAAVTALTPSLYIPMAQEINMREGRDANHWKGYPTAFAYGVATNLVLGHLQKNVTGNVLATAAKKGPIALLEMSGIEDAAALIDKVLPKAYRTGIEGSNVSKIMRGMREGKDITDPLEHALAQVVVFGLFGAMHREGKPQGEYTNKAAVEAFDKALGDLQSRGMKPQDSVRFLQKINDQVEGQIKNNPYISRERLLRNVDRMTDPTLKEYYKRIVEATVPDKPYGRMHDEAAKLDEGQLKEVGRDAESPLTGEVIRNEKGFDFAPKMDPRMPPENLIVREAVKESRSLFQKLLAQGSDPRDAASISQRVFDRTVATAAGAPESTGGKFAGKGFEPKIVTKTGAHPRDWAGVAGGKQNDKPTTGVPGPGRLDAQGRASPYPGMAGGNPQKQATAPQPTPDPKPKPDPAGGRPSGVGDFSNVSVEDARRAAPYLKGVPGPKAFGKWRPHQEIINDFVKHGITSKQFSDAIAKANAKADKDRLATAAKEPVIEATPEKTPEVSETPTAPPSAPESPTINEPTQPPVPTSEAEKAPETTPQAQPYGVKSAKMVRDAIDGNPSLTPDQQAEFRAGSAEVFQTLTPTSLKWIDRNLKAVKFFGNNHDLSVAWLKEAIDTKEIPEKLRAQFRADLEAILRTGKATNVGGFNNISGTLYVDGAYKIRDVGPYGVTGPELNYRMQDTLRHELGHVVDLKQAVSNSTPWKAIWSAEIKYVTTLTEYAKESFYEGFAEFYRIVHDPKIATDRIRKDFPMATKFFENEGLWPGERKGEGGKPTELFDTKIGDNNTHIDVDTGKPPLATAAKNYDAVRNAKSEVEKAYSAIKELEAEANSITDPNDPRIAELDRQIGEKTDNYKYLVQLYKYELENLAKANGYQFAVYTVGKDSSTPVLSKRFNDIAEANREAEFISRGLFRGDPSVARGKEILNQFGESDSGSVYRSTSDSRKVYVETIPYVADPTVSKPKPQMEVSKPAPKQPATDASGTKPKAGGAPPKPPAPKAEATELQRLQALWKMLKPHEREGVEGQKIAAQIKELEGEQPDVKETTKQVDKKEKEHIPIRPEVKKSIEEALYSDKLTVQESQVLLKRFGINGKNLTFDEIAPTAGKAGGKVERQRVEQIEKKAWKKLQEWNKDLFGLYKNVEDYLNSRRGMRTTETVSDITEEKGFEGDVTAERRIPTLKEIGDAVRAGGDWRKSIEAWTKKWLTKLNGLTEGQFNAKVARDGQVHAAVADVRNTEKDLYKSLGGYDKVTPDMARTLNEALDTKAPGYVAAVAKIRNTLANSDVVLKVLGDMREQVDTLTKKLIDSGAVPDSLKAVFQENLGAYLTRSYRVFSDPKWYKNVPEDVKNRFKSWLHAELTSERGTPPTDAEVQGIMETLLVDGKAAENPLAFIAQSKLGGRDLGIFKARKDIPAELRALWGEVQDPLANYVNSVARMSSLLANHKFLTRVREEGLGKHFFENVGEFKEAFPNEEPYKIAPTESSTMGPLAGLYTTKGLKDAFDRSLSREILPAYLQGYMKFLAATKYSKTIGSHVTHIRNFMGNTGFAVANGHWQMGNFRDSMKTLATDTPKSREEYRELLELGVVGDNVHANEFRDIINDALGVNSPFMGIRMGIATENRAADWARRGFDVAQRLYTAEDAVWKIYAFKNEVARYQKAYPEWSEQQIKAKAAEIVRNTYPTYSMVSPAVKAIRRLPLVGSFVSFPAEVVRTTYHTVRQALVEIQDPRTREIGYTRLGGLLTASVMSSAVSLATAAMFGMDSEDKKNMLRFVPEWSRNSQFLHLGKDSKGRYKYIDLSRNDPHAYLTDAVSAIWRADSPDDAALRAATAVAKPFIEEELGTRNILDIVRNKREEGGTVYNPQAPFSERAGAVIQHAAEPLTPGSYTSARRLAMGLAGAKEQRTGTEYNAQDEIVGNLGIRVSDVDTARSIGYKGITYTHGLTEAANLLTSMIRAKGNVSPQELATAAKRTDDARRALFNDMREDILAAERLGMTKQEIRESLKAAGVSNDEINRLMNNNYKPFTPEVKGIPALQRERVIGLRR